MRTPNLLMHILILPNSCAKNRVRSKIETPPPNDTLIYKGEVIACFSMAQLSTFERACVPSLW